MSLKSLILGISPLMAAYHMHMMADGESIVELDQNLDAYDDFELLPKGNYKGTCTLAEKRVSDNGNEYYYTNWVIAPEDYPDDYDAENAPEGTTLIYSRVQVAKSNDRRSITAVKRLMRAMGLELKTKVIDPDLWVGRSARLVISHETYNGERNARIQRIESLEA